MQSVGILIVGDEILSGEIADENGPWLISRLGAAGVRTVRQIVVPDDTEQIALEILRLRALADAVVISGGIGPTHDDVTRPAVAAALGVDLVPHAEAELRIRHFYGAAVTDAELSMAQVPAGAELVHGVKTGTFGFALPGLYVLPGVPFLFRDLMEGIAPSFRAPALHKEELRSARREGELASVLAVVQGEMPDVAIGSYPVCEGGCWHVRIVMRGHDLDRVRAVADRLRAST
ncbi:MAG: competence/damage-inducible protein A [Planctomycetota bacterium]|nr:competence/damage-inducible protein A [Planctomycetota bacterium]